jgi:propanediol dehydratase large subunit
MKLGYIIKTKKNDKTETDYYICYLDDKNNGWGVTYNITAADVFASKEEALAKFDKHAQTSHSGKENIDDYEVVQLNSGKSGEAPDYEKAIMNALRKGEGDNFGL